MAIYAGAFLAVWFLLYFLFRRRHPGADSSLMTFMMALTGICLVMMFSMNDPLNDKMLGVDMAQGIISGVIVMILLQAVDFKAFYQGKSRLPFDIPAAFLRLILWPWRNKVDALFARLPKGFGYMLTALGLTLLLFTPLGASVGGMRVNLNVGILFQPSEIAKYLIVIFMAAFFCVKADTVVKFSQKGNIDLFGVKMRMLYGILIGLAFLMGLYLLLGDMGPSMVLAFTFIIMYSFIKSKVSIEGLD
jgi:cell division protein FtsW (lipid II flippase)